MIYFHRTCVMIAGEILKLFMDEEKVEMGMEYFLFALPYRGIVG